VQRGLNQPELGERQPAGQQENGPDRAGEGDAVEELVQAEW
jgi:hypothetical protein